VNNNSNNTGKYLLIGGGLLAFLLLIGYGVTYVQVGPLTVGLTRSGNDSSTANNRPPSFDTNAVAIAPTPFELTKPATLVPTPQGYYNPSGIIDAGMPVYVDNLMLSVDSSSFEAKGDFVRVMLRITNVGTNKRLFRFTPGSVVVQDDSGRRYPPILSKNMSFGDCLETDLMRTKQIDVETNDTVELRSDNWYSDGTWCKFSIPNYTIYLPTYAGSVSTNAQYIILSFNHLGPFDSFGIRIRL